MNMILASLAVRWIKCSPERFELMEALDFLEYID